MWLRDAQAFCAFGWAALHGDVSLSVNVCAKGSQIAPFSQEPGSKTMDVPE